MFSVRKFKAWLCAEAALNFGFVFKTNPFKSRGNTI